ncbi:MAG: CAP domain-containing protein [Myxococcales bacterium]|nr:CAP domain-containing protein [Myxococcales bacterium]
MRELCCFALALVLLGCGSNDDDGGGGGAPGGSCDSAGTSPAAFECKIVELVNQHRAAGATCGGNAMPPVGKLTMHSTLRATARAHAADMAQKGYFAHDNLEGKSPFDRMSEAGYQWSTAGENIAAGSPTPEGAMDQWMKSPGHCANIMKAEFEDIGVGYAAQDGSKFTHYWVQNFGAQ